MSYVPGIPDNEATHEAYCDLICNGPAVDTTSSEHVVWESSQDQILLVTDASPAKYKKLAHDASKCANCEMRYDSGIYREYDPPDQRHIRIFLYARDARVIALLVFERRSKVWRCLWNGVETPECVEQPEKGPMWSVGFLWVHGTRRRVGVGKALFHRAKRHLNLTEDEVGWYTPFSTEGQTFVRHEYPTYFYVAK